MHTHMRSGGIEIIFNGTNLDVVQNPMLVIIDPQYLNVSNVSFVYCNFLQCHDI